MFTGIRARMTILLISLVVFFLAGIIGLAVIDWNSSAFLFAEKEESTRTLLYKSIVLNGNRLEAFAVDYSFWDEMIEFVSTGNKKWAANNIDTGLATFKANAAWIYRTDFSPVYSVNNIKDKTLTELPLPKEAFSKIFKSSYFQRFFVNTDKGIMEIRTGPIHPTSDVERKTAPRGYFFAGRLWDKTVTDDIAALAEGSAAVLASKPKEIRDQGKGLLAFSLPLTGWDGTTLGWLFIQKNFPTIISFNQSIYSRFFLFFIFALVLLAIPHIFIARWVTAPLKKISDCLDTGDPIFIKDLENDETEFGHLAKLVKRSFSEKSALSKEVAERLKAEKELEVKIKELEDFHDVTVGRELNLIELRKEIDALLKELGRPPKYETDRVD